MFIVVAPDACKESGSLLARILKGRFSQEDYIYDKNAIIFNYGMSWLGNKGSRVINQPSAVQICKNKLETFRVLSDAGVRIPKFTTSKKLARNWEYAVSRKLLEGKSNAGMDIIQKGDVLPDAKLYTEYFFHKKEYRVVVFKDEVAQILIKTTLENGMWELFDVPRTPTLRHVEKECLKAAKALGIDYVGFDVVYNNSNDFVILEANSGPVLTDTVGEFIKQKLKG